MTISAFPDGVPAERQIAAAALLLADGLLGMALGMRASGWYSLGLALPGLAALIGLGAGGEGRWWYPPYEALIALLAVGAARASAERWRADTPTTSPGGRPGDGHQGRAGANQVEGGRS